jgi:hypothetical protein
LPAPTLKLTEAGKITIFMPACRPMFDALALESCIASI